MSYKPAAFTSLTAWSILYIYSHTVDLLKLSLKNVYPLVDCLADPIDLDVIWASRSLLPKLVRNIFIVAMIGFGRLD